MPIILNDNEIFSSVINVISKYGYSGATTKLMANAAGISEVTLFRKFGNKQKLVKQSISFILAKSGIASSIIYTGEIRRDLTHFLEKYLSIYSKYGDFITGIINEVSYKPELADLIDAPKEIYLSFEKLISKYQIEGQLRKEHSIHTLAALIGPLVFVIIINKINPTMDIPRIDIQSQVDLFLEGRRV